MTTHKWKEWQDPERLAEIRQKASEGLNEKELATVCGINTRQFAEWLKKYEKFSEAVKAGRAECVQKVENALFKKAVGLTTKTRTKKIVQNESGEVKTEIVETETEVPPDTRALIFLLQHKEPEKFHVKAGMHVDELLNKINEVRKIEKD